jgi:hypothetical protein
MYNDAQPTYLEQVERIIVIGDLHGDVSRLMQILYGLKIFSNDLQWIAEPKNTIVVQLGDQIDSLSRGSTDEWEVLPDIEVMLLSDKLDNIARLEGGRFLSLIGNHEIMNIMSEFSYVSKKSLEKCDMEMRSKLFNPGNQLNNILIKRNIVLQIGDYIFCHGGLLPHHLDLVNNNLHTINESVRKCIGSPNTASDTDKQIFIKTAIEPNSILWTRDYLMLAQGQPEVLNDIVNILSTKIKIKAIFVGHNTVPFIQSVAHGRIFFTDTGISRAYPNEDYQIIEILNKEGQDTIYNISTITQKNDK